MKIEHLTKVYKSKDVECVGLNDVSFTLPEKGLVFVVGKSGSGKSTLLNLLGGLDEITSGDIIIGDKRFSEFSNRDFDDYRNSYLGFVFQDFCLIDELNVEENVRLALDLQNEKDTSKKVLEILDKVELREFAQRKVNQLSGGQRQRVAIARALVKSPKIILADEPTGNLDSKTSIQILDLLKVLSKDVLIVVVSHNIVDAEKYADRIIELADGKICGDKSRRENSLNTFEIDGDTIYIPDGKMTIEEIQKLNAATREGGKNIVQRDIAFEKTRPIKDAEIKADFRSSKLSFGRTLNITKQFSKRKLFFTFLMILMIAMIVLLFGLSRVFINFNADAAMDGSIHQGENNLMVLRKGSKNDITDTVETNYTVKISDGELEKFELAGSGKIYKKVAFEFLCVDSGFRLENGLTLNHVNYANFYSYESSGALICDKTFLAKTFGVDGELVVLAGDVDATIDSEGLIITDYIADSIKFFGKFLPNNATYDEFVNKNFANRGRVSAVISTGYKEKFTDYIKKIQNHEQIEPEERADFIEYADTYLNVVYTFNQNFVQDFAQSGTSLLGFINCGTIEIEDEDGNLVSKDAQGLGAHVLYSNETSKDSSTCAMNITLYSKMFGVQLASCDDPNFQPKNMHVNLKVRGSDEVQYSFDLRVVEVYADSLNTFRVFDKEILENFAMRNIYAYELYFDQPTNASAVYRVGEENDFYIATEYFKTVNSISKIVLIFKDSFVLIASVLCAIVVLSMIAFCFGNIQSKKYQIGVLRALGSRTKDIVGIFITQIVLVGLIICVLFALAFYFIIPFANDLLINSFVKYVNDASITNIKLLAFDPYVMLTGFAIIVGVTLMSTIAPFVAVRRIKPINIIKSKD